VTRHNHPGAALLASNKLDNGRRQRCWQQQINANLSRTSNIGKSGKERSKGIVCKNPDRTIATNTIAIIKKNRC